MDYSSVFFGRTYRRTKFGGVDIKGNGDNAKIKIIDKKNNETTATLKVYDRSALKNTNEFQDQNNKEKIQNLFHTWHLIDSKNSKIIYSDEVEQGFICTMGPGFDFEKLGSCELDIYLDYFKELGFLAVLPQGYTLEKLRGLPGMTDQKMDLIIESYKGLGKLRENGISVDQIVALSEEKLKNILHNAHYVSNALTCITINQLLGVDHIPVYVADQTVKVDCRTIRSGRSGSTINGIEKEHDGTSSTMTYSCPNKNEKYRAEMSIQPLDEKLKATLTKDIAALEPERLVHDWWKLDKVGNDDRLMVQFYCPQIPELTVYRSDKGFPTNECHHLFCGYQHYTEKRFVDFMSTNNLPINQARKIAGYTQTKLELLCQNFYVTEKLVRLGLNLNDVAKISESRLSFILGHHTEIDHALKFVDVSELMGLRGSGLMLNSYHHPSRAPASVPAPVVQVEEEQGFTASCSIC